MSLKLLEYTKITENQYNNYIQEWEKSNELIVPSAIKRNGESFSNMMKKWNLSKRCMPMSGSRMKL